MKTAEEKAREYVSNQFSRLEHSYEMQEMIFRTENGFLAGYTEAMRWRDPKEELPENQEIVLVKSDNGCYATAYCHGASGCFIDYGRDAYVDFGEIIGWRPIE